MPSTKHRKYNFLFLFVEYPAQSTGILPLLDSDSSPFYFNQLTIYRPMSSWESDGSWHHCCDPVSQGFTLTNLLHKRRRKILYCRSQTWEWIRLNMNNYEPIWIKVWGLYSDRIGEWLEGRGLYVHKYDWKYKGSPAERWMTVVIVIGDGNEWAWLGKMWIGKLDESEEVKWEWIR